MKKFQTLEIVLDSTRLLSKSSRRKLIILVFAQAALSLLDLIGIALLGLVVVILSGASSTGIKPTWFANELETIVPNSDLYSAATAVAAVAAVLMIVKSLISYWLMRKTLRFLAHRQAEISGALAEKFLEKPLTYVQQNSSQETAITLTHAVSQLTLGVIGGAVIIASETGLLLILLLGLLFVDLPVTFFSIIFFGLIALVSQRIMTNWAHRLGLESFETHVKSLSSIQEAIRTYRELTVSGRRDNYIKRFQNLRWQTARVQSDLRMMTMVSKYIYEIALVVGAGMLALSQFTTKSPAAAITVLTIFLAASSRILPSLLRIQSAGLAIRSAAAESTNVLQLAREVGFQTGSPEQFEIIAPGVFENDSARERIPLSVQIDHCYVKYPMAETLALDDITVKIEAGTFVGIVGPTGSGKSTLADLILGVIQPLSGRVLIGERTPDEVIKLGPGSLAYVPQDVALIDGSIRSNVGLALDENLVSDHRVLQSLVEANLKDFLDRVPQGLEAPLGENGVRVSGGEKQRIGIARALFTDPQLMVLDESTSALDAETESSITGMLRTLSKKTTLIVIAHRLATIRDCDQIIYLDKGRVLATGNFSEVRAQIADFDRQATLLGL